jgi:hypothetical protein
MRSSPASSEVQTFSSAPCSRKFSICFLPVVWDSKFRTHKNLLTYFMLQDIIWKVDSHSACQKILFSLWNLKVHYRVHKSSPLDPILSQPNPVRSIDPYLPKVQLNVIFLPTPRSSHWSLAFGRPNQKHVNTFPLPHACHMSRPPHPPWFNHPNNIRWRIQAMKFIITQFSHDPSSSLLGPYIFLNTLISKTLSLCSSLKVS